ncbi:DUF4352 domain-containing protein [Sutcliffiella sp. NPDC057660]|uniref:DUF4352 domain-containing protein n=1 Tax=Sutcliffiella sp. NPDC057660 TaxID=3346199 RepID=UPI003686ECF7
MRLKPWIALTLTAALLAGCTANSSNNSASEVHAETQANGKSTEILSFKDSPQAPDDRELTIKDSQFKDEDGSITLKQFAQVHEKKQTGNISMTISDVKVMQYKPSPDLIDFFHGFTHEETEFPYVRVNVVVKNNGDKPMHIAPVSEITTNQGETVTWEDDFYLEKLNGELKPGEEKVGSLGFILDETDPEALESLTISSSEVLDGKKDKMADGVEFEVRF